MDFKYDTFLSEQGNVDSDKEVFSDERIYYFNGIYGIGGWSIYFIFM